jgi:hypothetical protein
MTGKHFRRAPKNNLKQCLLKVNKCFFLFF